MDATGDDGLVRQVRGLEAMIAEQDGRIEAILAALRDLLDRTPAPRPHRY
ncbi:hypothetical protein [Actinocorallia longicatena]|uniref:SlyX protein n=1 Tax=Actinocorallia longicatena TaxID=111803 RepID=A0ABP6PZT4_9ACTN